MSDTEEELYDFENEELDYSYENVHITRHIYDYIKDMCKNTSLFSELIECELYEFLYPQEEE